MTLSHVCTLILSGGVISAALQVGTGICTYIIVTVKGRKSMYLETSLWSKPGYNFMSANNFIYNNTLHKFNKRHWWLAS